MRYSAAIFSLAALAAVAQPASAQAETIATFTRNPANPILRGVRIGAEIAATSLGAQTVHFIPRSEAPAEQIGLIEEVINNKPAALVLAPFDPKLMVPAVDKLNAAGIPMTNVNECLSGGKVVSYVGTDDYALALTTARYLIKALGGKGNVVILEGHDNLPTSILQGCLGVEIAIRSLRQQPVPKEVNLKAVVVDKTNYQPYETPMERRSCPALETVAAN